MKIWKLIFQKLTKRLPMNKVITVSTLKPTVIISSIEESIIGFCTLKSVNT